MIDLDQVFPPLAINVFDAVEMRVISLVNLADDAAIGRCFVRDDCHGAIEPDSLDRFVEKGFVAFASRRAVRRKSFN